MNYYPHHLGDYLRDTAHLSMLEDGAYRRLIDAYYLREGLLPADEKQICRLVRATSRQEKHAIHVVLLEFFQKLDSGWRHKRCEEELAKIRAKSEKARESGLASGAARRTDVQRTFNGRSTNAERTLNYPITNNQEPEVRPSVLPLERSLRPSLSDRADSDVLQRSREKKQAVASLLGDFGKMP